MEQSKSKKSSKKWIYALIGCLLVIVAGVSVVLFLLQGETKVTNSDGSKEVAHSLVCEGNIDEYPFFKHDDSDSKSVKVNALYDGEKLDSISFTYQMTYKGDKKDVKDLKKISDANSGDIEKEFDDSGVNYGAFDIKFTTLENGVQMAMYAKTKELSSSSAKFFLLDSASGQYKVDNLKNIYGTKGLKCVENK